MRSLERCATIRELLQSLTKDLIYKHISASHTSDISGHTIQCRLFEAEVIRVAISIHAGLFWRLSYNEDTKIQRLSLFASRKLQLLYTSSGFLSGVLRVAIKRNKVLVLRGDVRFLTGPPLIASRPAISLVVAAFLTALDLADYPRGTSNSSPLTCCSTHYMSLKET